MQRVFLYSIVLLLCFVFSVTYADTFEDDFEALEVFFDIITTTATPAANSSVTPTGNSTNATTTKPYVPYGSRYGYNHTRKGNRGGYYDDSYELVGVDGKDPSRDGTDIGDFGPVFGRKPMSKYLDIWITEDDNWEQKGSTYNKKNYKEKPYKGSRSKRSYKKVSFPTKHIKNYRKFPTNRFPPLISILPWVPIFYDRRTYQTIIFSPTGGLFIIPPLINFYGERFAVAQLIKWGYASLVSSGAPVGPGVDVAPLVHPPPAGGAVAGGAVVGGGNVPFDSKTSQFVGGVSTKFKKFKPRYPKTIDEGGESSAPRNPRSGSMRPSYASNLDLGNN